MKNLDKFNEIAIKIFDKCYNVFPLPCTFCINEFFDEINEGNKDIFSSSFLILKKYNYIYIENITLGCFIVDGVQLTEKALHILNCTPSSLEERCSIGQKVSQAAKEGTKIAFSETAKMIIQYGVAFFTKM